MHHVRQGWTEMLSSVQLSRVCQFKSHTVHPSQCPRRFICMQVCFLAQRLDSCDKKRDSASSNCTGMTALRIEKRGTGCGISIVDEVRSILAGM